MNILGFFAHPDDETVLCGGTLVLLSRRGARVHILTASRGDGGETGEPPLCTQAELGRVREAELRCAVQALETTSLTFLGYVDPTIGPNDEHFSFTQDDETLANQVVEAIRRTDAQVLLSHGSNGEYGHPAHVACHRAARRAVEILGSQAPLFYTAQAAFLGHPIPMLMNESDPAHLILDVSTAVPAVTQAVRCHRSQNALFTRAASEEAGRSVDVSEIVFPVESLHRVWPILQPTDRPADDFSTFLTPD